MKPTLLPATPLLPQLYTCAMPHLVWICNCKSLICTSSCLIINSWFPTQPGGGDCEDVWKIYVTSHDSIGKAFSNCLLHYSWPDLKALHFNPLVRKIQLLKCDHWGGCADATQKMGLVPAPM